MSAFRGKAVFCGGPLLQSLIGVKRTSRFALHMSASDPKQTCADAIREPGQYQSKRDIHWVDFAVGSWSKPDYFAFNCALELQVNTVVSEVPISLGRNRHATRFCISDYLHDGPRAGGITSQSAKLVG